MYHCCAPSTTVSLSMAYFIALFYTDVLFPMYGVCLNVSLCTAWHVLQSPAEGVGSAGPGVVDGLRAACRWSDPPLGPLQEHLLSAAKPPLTGFIFLPYWHTSSVRESHFARVWKDQKQTPSIRSVLSGLKKATWTPLPLLENYKGRKQKCRGKSLYLWACVGMFFFFFLTTTSEYDFD